MLSVASDCNLVHASPCPQRDPLAGTRDHGAMRGGNQRRRSSRSTTACPSRCHFRRSSRACCLANPASAERTSRATDRSWRPCDRRLLRRRTSHSRWSDRLRCRASRLTPRPRARVLHPDHAPASRLAPLVEHDGKHGFAVVDMTDVDDFSRIASVTLPAGPVYIWSRSSIAAITWPTGAPTRRCRRSSPPDGLPHPQRRPPLATPAARGT